MQKCIYWLQGLLTRLLMAVFLVTGTLANATDVITYIHTDISGSPLAATNETGAVVWKESYRAYGQRAVQMPYTEGQQQWFHGKEQDEVTGYQYFGARYYDPAVGRFMGIDPVDFQEGNPHSFNRYGYGNNNPVKYLDPDGRHPVVPFVFLWGVALWADGGGIGPIGTPAGAATGLSATSAKAAAQAGHKLTPVASAVQNAAASGAYTAPRKVGWTPTLKAEAFAGRSGGELKRIYQWGDGLVDVQNAMRNLDANAMTRIKGSLTRENVEAMKYFYQDAAARGKGGNVAPQRAEYMDRILKLWEK